jgi:hypothetical protein
MELIHQFITGRSGSSVYLARQRNQIGVYKTKIKNVKDIVHACSALPFKTPKIYSYTDTTIFMEYISGISIRTYLETATVTDLDRLVNYISSYFDFCLNSSTENKDYKDLILDKHDTIASLCNEDLTYKFNYVLPNSPIHGDFTFDNLLYYNNDFYMIDISPTVFDSVYFDANKLRQDLTGLWFVRNYNNKANYRLSCNYIYDKLKHNYPYIFDDNIYKFMLSRILPYCVNYKEDYDFIMKEINRL